MFPHPRYARSSAAIRSASTRARILAPPYASGSRAAIKEFRELTALAPDFLSATNAWEVLSKQR